MKVVKGTAFPHRLLGELTEPLARGFCIRATCSLSTPLLSQRSEKVVQRLFLLFGLDIIEDRIGPLSIARAAGAADQGL